MRLSHFMNFNLEIDLCIVSKVVFLQHYDIINTEIKMKHGSYLEQCNCFCLAQAMNI